MKTITTYAKQNRKRPTKAERALAVFLLRQKLRFRTQRMYDFYIVDFLIPERWLVIELDGSFHVGREAYDARRDAYIKAKGFTILRFPNETAINNPMEILRAIEDHPLKPAPIDWKLLYGTSAY